jgi:FtsP/CotA-like multicopper oxidase with cupredoxin domain
MRRSLLQAALAVGLASLIAAAPAHAFINDSPNLIQAADTNSDPSIFETTLTARQVAANIVNPACIADFCRVANAAAFNGIVPGPEIRVKQGTRVIVHYTNALPASAGNTSIHWHGVELANRSDGTAVTQQPLLPGQTITYDFTVPRAGIFWFHGHMSPNNQSLKGLYGSLVVTSPEDEKLQGFFVLPPPSRTKTLMLSDITSCKAAGFNDAATFPADPSLPWAGDTNGDGVKDPFIGKSIGPSPKALCETPYDNYGRHVSGPLAERTVPNVQYDPDACPLNKLIDLSAPCTVNEGQSVLVNGRVPAARGGSPDGGGPPTDVASTADVLTVHAGDTYRLQMTNAALARYFRLRMTDKNDAQVTLFRVGGEGGVLNRTRVEGGLNANPKYLNYSGQNTAGNPQYSRGEILLAPGQRADVVFNVPSTAAAGDVITLWTRDFQRGMSSDGANPLEKAPTAPNGCAAGAGRCGPNGYSITPTVPVLHLKVAAGGFASFPAAKDGTPLLTDSRVNKPLEDIRTRSTVPLLTPSQGGQTLGSTNPVIELNMGGTPVGSTTDFTNLRPMIDHEIVMLDDNRSGVPTSSIARPHSTRYVRLGDIVELKVRNTTGMNHPFHLHGASFQPVRIETNPLCTGATTPQRVFDYPEYMDTFDVPACSQFVFHVRYDDRPIPALTKGGGATGRWVFHCHIFEHASDGMMGELDVIPPAGPRFFGLRVNGFLAAGATVTATLRKRRVVALKVVRLVKHGGKPTKRVQLGRVALGTLRAGSSHVHWNLKVRGKRLRPGRYEVSMHSVTDGALSQPARPGPRTLVVSRGGRVRLAR